MPDLSNIQTYGKIDGSDFRPALERFCRVLQNIDLWNDDIQNAFDQFEWNVEDGLVYESFTPLGYFKSKLSDVKISPLVMVHSPGYGAISKDNWMCCELLIESEDLRSFKDGQFHNHTYGLVKTLIFEMQKEFKQTGIYFTDELQDGSDFDGISSNDSSKLWQFDYALIPLTHEKLYLNKPVSHSMKRHDNYLEIWTIDRWKEKL